MDRAQLARWIEEGLSLDAMAAKIERHPSTVSYWINKHGLQAVGASVHGPKGGIEKSELKELIDAEVTIGDIAERLGASSSNVRYWIRRYGLDRERIERRAAIRQARGRGRRGDRAPLPKPWSDPPLSTRCLLPLCEVPQRRGFPPSPQGQAVACRRSRGPMCKVRIRPRHRGSPVPSPRPRIEGICALRSGSHQVFGVGESRGEQVRLAMRQLSRRSRGWGDRIVVRLGEAIELSADPG